MFHLFGPNRREGRDLLGDGAARLNSLGVQRAAIFGEQHHPDDIGVSGKPVGIQLEKGEVGQLQHRLRPADPLLVRKGCEVAPTVAQMCDRGFQVGESLLKSGAPGALAGEFGQVVHRFGNFLRPEEILNELNCMEKWGHRSTFL